MDWRRLTEDVSVEMRDGALLAADVYRLDGAPGSGSSDEGLPTLVTRTPYDKREKREMPAALARRGYAVVV